MKQYKSNSNITLKIQKHINAEQCECAACSPNAGALHTHEHTHGENCGCGSHAHESEHAHEEGCGCCRSASSYLQSPKEKFKLLSVQNILMLAGVIVFIFAMIFKTDIIYIDLPIFLAAYALIGYEILWGFFKNLIKLKIFDENFLMTVASAGAFVLGEYFEGVMVVLLFSIGERFQAHAVKQSYRGISNALSLIAQTATVLRGDKQVVIDSKEIAVGDILLLKQGEKCAVDAIMLSDEGGYFDTSMITGESMPRYVKQGETVLSGFIATDNTCTLRAEKTLENSTVTKIYDMLKIATTNKSKAENFITVFSKIYTPIVCVVAAFIGGILPLILGVSHMEYIWMALTFLIISCPCAIVISVPLCYFFGLYESSRAGVLLKGSNYLSKLADIDTMVFDKTGTLTTGEFKIDEIVSLSSMDRQEIFDYIYALENFSNHPLAKVILKGEKVRTFEVAAPREVAGDGIYGEIDGKVCFAGKISELKLNSTAIGLRIDGEVAGYITLSDSPEASSLAAIQKLKKYGVKNISVLSGDNEHAVKALADKLQIDSVYFEKTPTEKLEIIESITRQNPGRTAYIGDGLNDALALKRADLGVSIASENDLSINAGDALITSKSIMPLADAKRVANRTKKKAVFNIAMSLTVKIAIMALSFAFNIPMIAAVLADTGLSLVAILIAMKK